MSTKPNIPFRWDWLPTNVFSRTSSVRNPLLVLLAARLSLKTLLFAASPVSLPSTMTNPKSSPVAVLSLISLASDSTRAIPEALLLEAVKFTTLLRSDIIMKRPSLLSRATVSAMVLPDASQTSSPPPLRSSSLFRNVLLLAARLSTGFDVVGDSVAVNGVAGAAITHEDPVVEPADLAVLHGDSGSAVHTDTATDTAARDGVPGAVQGDVVRIKP